MIKPVDQRMHHCLRCVVRVCISKLAELTDTKFVDTHLKCLLKPMLKSGSLKDREKLHA